LLLIELTVHTEGVRLEGQGGEKWRNGSASISNVRGSGFEPYQGQGFSHSYEVPNDRLVTLTSFGWDNKPR
jgi:hypothetical protein